MSDPANSIRTSRKQLILSAIAEDVTLPPVTRMYVVGLFFTACAVLLLPLLYLVLTALFVGSLYSFFHNVDFILAGWTPMWKWIAIGCVGFFGSSCVLGLVKPLFAKSSSIKKPRELSRDAEPFLFEYIDRLCDAIGACRPSAIYVTGDLNAGAEFRQRWLNPFVRNETLLHLGLPLVAGMTLREFTGIVAHELGHFSQRTAMWLENFVLRTNLWLFRAAYERDAVDDWLIRESASGWLWAIPCYFATGIVWVTRRVILAFAFVGTIVSSLMSREMEFNADRCQVRTVGSKAHASTFWKMRQLHVAQQISLNDIKAFWDEGRLPDNIVSLVIANLEFLTPKIKKRLRQMMTDEKTGIFDTHPSDCDRVRAGELDGSTGIFRRDTLPNDLPAAVLFSRFEQVSKAITFQFYENVFNRPIKAHVLHPVDKLLERQNAQIEAAKALRRYFQTDIPLMRPLPIAPHADDPAESPLEVARHLKACRDRMLKELPEYRRLVPRYRSAEETLFELIAAQTLQQAGLSFQASDFRLVDTSPKAISSKHKRARDGVANLAGKLLPFETEAGSRLSLSLHLLRVPGVVKRITDGDNLKYEIDDLLPQAQYVSRLMGELPTLRIIYLRLLALWERLSRTNPNREVLDTIVSQMTTLRMRLISIQSEMGDRLYPFDHARAETTLRAYALPEIPGELDLGGLVQATDHMQSRLVTIQTRLFARLAHAAEKIEVAIGMPPLPEPEVETID